MFIFFTCRICEMQQNKVVLAASKELPSAREEDGRFRDLVSWGTSSGSEEALLFLSEGDFER